MNLIKDLTAWYNLLTQPEECLGVPEVTAAAVCKFCMNLTFGKICTWFLTIRRSLYCQCDDKGLRRWAAEGVQRPWKTFGTLGTLVCLELLLVFAIYRISRLQLTVKLCKDFIKEFMSNLDIEQILQWQQLALQAVLLPSWQVLAVTLTITISYIW